MDAQRPGLDGLYDDAPCGLLVAAADGRLVRVNRTLCRWLQYEPGEMLDLRFQDLLTMGGRIFHQTHLAPLLKMQGSVAEVSLEIRRKDGTAAPMILNMVERPVDGQPQLQAACFVAEDRRRYERELLQQRQRAEALAAELARSQEQIAAARAQAEDRALVAEQMVGVVSHDLRNPLSAILMSAAVLERGDLSTPQRTVVGRISRSVDRAQRLIGDLLDFTQARLGGGLAVRTQEVDLHEVIAECVNELAMAFPQRTIVHLREGGGRRAVDSDRLTQAVGNLVGNAVAYGAPALPITVTTRVAADGAAGIMVHNLGQPIPESLLANLFEPMIRGPEDKHVGGRGVGLGLYIVREIARAHGGSVDVTSAAAGTCFTIRLPGTTSAP